MRVLVVGGGAREHAIAAALNKSKATLYAAMNNRNPGIQRLCEDVLFGPETDVDAVAGWAEGRVDMAFIGPEAPLEKGLADALISRGIGVVGPTKDAARIETSKAYMRKLMTEYDIPGQVVNAHCRSLEEAEAFLDDFGESVVVKPIGLCGGKGAKVFGEHLHNREDILEYARSIFSSGMGGGELVIEEKLVGEEFTLQCFSDGSHVAPMPLVQDHKRAYEGDKGPNTGGMGSYSMKNHSLPFITDQEYQQALAIVQRTVDAMAQDGSPYKGILYGQFILTKDGPKVIEFNARFGDPEAMNVLSIIDSSFLDVCIGMVEGGLKDKRPSFKHTSTVCKYVVPRGYGIKSEVGVEVEVDEKAIEMSGAKLFYASVNEKDGKIYTTSSRTLAVVGISPEIGTAEEVCETALSSIRGDVFMRHDIGKAASIQKKISNMRDLRGEGEHHPHK
ncbi:MAG: phosphoribosylamine--glycine ligase [Candidatus Thermoplasmatota archaeon]|nr:phosphoribosylamine--glycine ligase [Candidatus Thermoplasmatota archaeon]